MKPRPRRTLPIGVWYGLAALACALVIIIAQVALYTSRREPRDVRTIVERELTMNTLQPGEQVVRSLPVYRRAGTDYFRRTIGVLVLTDRRLVYLGATPRDVTGATDAAPTFDQRVFPIDTLVNLDRAFVMLGLARGLSVASPYGDLTVGVPSKSWADAQTLRRDWEARHATLGQIGAWAQKVREARAQIDQELERFRKQPVYHVVRPGDAISSIADWYETSGDEIRALNSIEGNKIKVGQRLLIRKGS